jgi:hypothetical protein
MKPLLLSLLIIQLVGCTYNRKDAIQNICKGVNSTGKAYRSSVGLGGKNTECGLIKEPTEKDSDKQTDLTSMELHADRMRW